MNPRKRRLARNRRSIRRVLARGEVATLDDLKRIDTRFVPDGTAIRIRETRGIYVFYPKGLPLNVFADAVEAVISPDALIARKGHEYAMRMRGAEPKEYTSAYPESLLRGIVKNEKGKVVAFDVDSKEKSK